MARPRTIDDQRLLKIAREVFLEQGAAATTAEVARRAGIAQGSIFKRYTTKLALFHAAMQSEALPFAITLRRRFQEEDLKAGLVEAGVEIVHYARKLMPAMMMIWSNRAEFGPSEDLKMSRSGPAPAERDLLELFGSLSDSGRIRKTLPRALAHTFIGSLQHYVLIELVRGHKPASPAEVREFVEGVVQIIWGGIAPEGARR
jgi:AcrR family transcriptional regulator